MLELFGKSYVVDNCIAFLQHKRRSEQALYYVTDCIKIIAENTAGASLVGGRTMKQRFYDIVSSKPHDERSANEIIESIKQKLEA